MNARTDAVECVIVGAGPAGLTAATYLCRFRRRIALIDAGASRARWIPTSHNCPGFPLGVSGDSLLARLRAQAIQAGAELVQTTATTLSRHGDLLRVGSDDGRSWDAPCVILATGVVDVLPPLPDAPAAIEAGVLRLCAICDGFEARDRSIAVFGPPSVALPHAIFLRTFSRDVCVLPDTDAATDPALRTQADAAGVRLLRAAAAFDADTTRCRIRHTDGSESCVDVLYPALGARSQNALAVQVGARVDDAGALLVDAHQRTSVPGLYAIGDVVSALNQIAVAVGHAAIAATDAHNTLPSNAC